MLKNIVVKPVIPTQNPTNIYYGLLETQEYGKFFLASYLENDLVCICFLHFVLNDGGQTMAKYTNDLQKCWPQSLCINDNAFTKKVYGKYLRQQNEQQEVYVALNGTDFQNKVWLALLDIPYGEESSYANVAINIGNPKAIRAVGNAVAANNIAVLVPCHRVKPKRGDPFKYRWGSELKRQLLLNEKMNN